MSRRKTDVIVGLVTVIVGLVLSLIVGIVTANPVATVLTSFLVVIVGVLVDIRLSTSQLLSEVNPPLIGLFEQFRNDKCELFRTMATEKYDEIGAFFRNLQEDRIEESDPAQIMHILEFLFAKANVVQSIAATSYGEMDEWLEQTSWITSIYLRMQMSAHLRGVKVERIFLDSKRSSNKLGDVCRLHLGYFVDIKTVDPVGIAPELLHRVGNALVFFDRHRNPVYAARADHHEGKLEKITFYRDQYHIHQINDNFNRIRELADVYVLTEKATTTPPNPAQGTRRGESDG
jgi:hypothetical protein